MKPIIGITSGEVHNKLETWAPVIYGQSRTYIDSIIEAGGVPYIMPLTDDKEVIKRVYGMIDGLFLTGGNDVTPELYGETPTSDKIDNSPFRDNVEKQFLTRALKDRKPVLGICRGMQFINVMCGGSLYQDIPTELPSMLDHNASTTHKDVEHMAHSLRIKPDTKLADILQTDSIKTNSHHHQAIKELGKNLMETAWSEDGLIEALEHTDHPYLIAVQAHPESLTQAAEPTWCKLFESFVEASKPNI